MRFGVSGPFMLYIVSASELGNALVEYYRKVIRDNEQRIALLKTRGAPAGLLKGLPGEYPGIEMTRLPDGLYEEAKVDVVVAQSPLERKQSGNA